MMTREGLERLAPGAAVGLVAGWTRAQGREAEGR